MSSFSVIYQNSPSSQNKQICAQKKCYISHQTNKRATEDCALSFMSGHPELILGRRERNSGARAMIFNGIVVEKFFTLLHQAIVKKMISEIPT